MKLLEENSQELATELRNQKQNMLYFSMRILMKSFLYKRYYIIPFFLLNFFSLKIF